MRATMKCGTRLYVCLSAAVLIGLFILVSIGEDRWQQYRGTEFVSCSVKNSIMSDPTCIITPSTGEVGDKVVVMGRLESEDVSWVAEYLPDWQHALYMVNPSEGTSPDTLTTPINKGHEAMAYLTYIIDHYDVLPSSMAFLHSHRSGFLTAWHVDNPLHDNVWALQHLQLDFVQENGYVNLRCNWNPGCEKTQRHNKHITHQVWQEIFADTSTPPINGSETISSETGNAMPAPAEVGAACCAQFAVSRQQVLQRPKSDYEKFRQWLFDTEKDDAHSGRVFEYLWHIIFGKTPVYCPDAEFCYCQVYGSC